MLRRSLAWIYTGPLGHLAAGAADWGELLGRHWWSKGRARVARLGRGRV